jgi:hypothetical protein
MFGRIVALCFLAFAAHADTSLIVLHLALLHTVDGHEVMVNPEQVTSIQAARPDEPNKFLTEKVACAIGMTNGKFVSVVEDCDTVRKILVEESAR